jgi:transposase
MASQEEPLWRNRRQRLDDEDGAMAVPCRRILRLRSALDRFELLTEQVKAVETERDALVAPAARTVQMPAPQAILMGLKGIGAEFAAILWPEGLYRSFANRKQVAAYGGLAPTPWQSGSVAREQGVSKAGNPRLRTTMIQLAWRRRRAPTMTRVSC